MLISTGTVRTWLSIATDDITPNAKIDSLIKAIQDFCDSYTGRELEAGIYTSDVNNCIFDGSGKAWIYTKQYPLSHVNDIRVDADREWGSGAIVATNDVYFYPSGKIVSEAGYFTKGRRNVRIDYNAGYAPVVGGTHNSAVGSYPCPYDLQQTMVEMVVQSFKEGITMVHTVENENNLNFVQMLSQKSFWRKTLNNYKNYAIGLDKKDE